MSRGAIVNIAGAKPIDDPEYRYKMPLVYGKIEGRGNGIKTVIPNVSDVAFSLHRDPGEVNKFFGCELGAQTSYSAETDRAVVNGAHNDMVLQTLMKKYIDKFVLCPQCGLPETKYKVKTSPNSITHRCAACGATESVDMSHKLCTYILAQDKKNKKDKKKDKKKKGKDGDDDEKKKDKKKKKKDKKEGSDEDDGEKKKKKKKDKKDKEKKKKDKSGHVEDTISTKETDDLVDAMDDLSVESGADVNDAAAMDLAVNATKKFLLENPGASPEEVVELVINQQMASALKSHDKVHIFVCATITSEFFKEKQIPKYAPVIALITNGNLIMERHLIAALEGICIGNPKHFPVMLKQFYDEDALDEDAILDWAVEGRNEYTLDCVDEESRAVLRGEAEPVVVWLQDDDSEEEDDE